MPKLGVNIDHVATLRQARRASFPDPILAAAICEEAGCDSIVAHLREDRRHINDSDIKRLKKAVKSRFNMEMSISQEIVDIACAVKPDQVTLVPEKREELTTEGGLNVKSHKARLREAVRKLTGCGIEVSLFIDADKDQIIQVPDLGVKVIEIHTGRFAEAKSKIQVSRCLKEIVKLTGFARGLGLRVNAGHGLNYDNTADVARIEGIDELNIGYSIICRSIFVGLRQAVEEMLGLVRP